ncbi:hypothetical protein LTR84_012318 [Exophiala bonariae]|uniref:Dienelactone hydrolase domain-containing protein n=1 Tax=Exophiala bonariae TaxID=1690606 RepID=A0AAV9NJI4_9EURO|nr:hypothetical protein LTR84_012318 [Exophiala bonariae]
MADEYSAACCVTPAAIVGEYAFKGSWIEINGIKTYVTGPPSARKAIVHVYDLFGYCPQTYQGADILATRGSEPYIVFVPDFIGSDRAAQHDWFLPSADQKPLHDLLAIVTSKQMMEDIHATVAALRSDGDYAHVQRWGGVGFCWGSKGISLIATQGDQSLLDVTAHTSPSRLDPEEAKTITVPTLMLTSSAEDESIVARYYEALKGPKYLERFDEIHGFMSARYGQTLFSGDSRSLPFVANQGTL